MSGAGGGVGDAHSSKLYPDSSPDMERYVIPAVGESSINQTIDDEKSPLFSCDMVIWEERQRNLWWWQRSTWFGIYIPKRYILVVIAWLGFFNVYGRLLRIKL